MRSKAIKAFAILAGLGVVVAAMLAAATAVSLRPVGNSFHDIASNVQTVRITDRNGLPLNISYQNEWNVYDHIPLYEVPKFLKEAIILAEDKRFYRHGGIDWLARAAAVRQNLTNLRAVRGASTISEQVVRMLNPRPRTIWSRWLEGFEAALLERTISKADILEFYINQVPYASNRRGIIQAARFYFNRDLSTLSHKEMLALAVLVRAPSGFDLYQHPGKLEGPLMRLADSMREEGYLEAQEDEYIKAEELKPEPATLPVEARHFARHIRLNSGGADIYRTTLDASLQIRVQEITDNRLKSLANKNVNNAAAIVADHVTGEILAWVVGGAGNEKTPAVEVDTVTTPRQPGSSLKPFLYAQALEKGWSAATIINDSPLAEAIGSGLHNFRNYSNVYYGPVTLREALGNSLNIPALKTIHFVGAGDYLTKLHRLGFESLTRNSEIYDKGLALGNGEVTLLEMTQAFAALANKGVYRPLRVLQQQGQDLIPRRIYSEETASLIGNILSDPWARRLEFGSSSILNLPLQSAVKTGTSTDYRDAWTIGYSDRYVVGIWMGNLDNSPMNEVTGSAGPALALRSIFALLNENRETLPLWLSPKLTLKEVCVRPSEEGSQCVSRSEWFIPGTEPGDNAETVKASSGVELVRPTDGLQIAYDPRIPPEHQKFRFELKGLPPEAKASWVLNGRKLAESTQNYYLWPLEKGEHVLAVSLNVDGYHTEITPVHFQVK